MINLDGVYVSLRPEDLNRQIVCTYRRFKGSSAKIQAYLMDYYGWSHQQAPSTRYIENVISKAEKNPLVKEILYEMDAAVAPSISAMAGDELCSPSPYIFYLSTVPHSGYCTSLNIYSDHSRGKKEKWIESYGPLIEHGLNPITVTSDQSLGTMSGQIQSFKGAYFIADFFHLYNSFKEAKEQAQRECEKLQKEWEKIYHARIGDKPIASCAKNYDGLGEYYLDDEGPCNAALETDYACLALAPDLIRHQLEIEEDLKTMQDIAENIKTLLSWMAGYILTLAGDNIKDRVEIYDMIVEGMEDCAKLTMTKKCSDIAGSMRRQIEKLLNFLPFLDDQFHRMVNDHHNKIDAGQSNLTKEIMWRINKYLHYAQDNQKGIDLGNKIKQIIGDDLFSEMVEKIRHLHETTVTCSSYAENHISRLKPYIVNGDKKSTSEKLTQKKMDFLRLFLNTSNLHSSRDYNKRSKTPLQIMLGDQHDMRWIDYFFDKPIIKQRGFIHPEMLQQPINNEPAYIKAA